MLVISNLEFGGAQRQLVELTNALTDDFHVTVCVLSDYVPLRESLDLPEGDFLIIKKRSKYDFTVPIRLALEARRRGIDVLHAYLFDAEIAARIAGWLAWTPAVIGSERNSDYRIKRNQMLAYKLTKRLRHHCIANSHRGAEFNARALRYPPSHYSVVLNGVDTTRFTAGSEPEIREQLDVPEDVFLIGMFGSFKEQKNQPMLIQALQILHDRGINYRVLFVGDKLHGGAQNTAAYYDSVVTLGEELGVNNNCRYLGNVQEVQRYYRACDVTVLPSLFEGTPNVVLESLACGVPAIVTNVASNDRIIEHGKNGYLVSVGDVETLASHLSELQRNGDLRMRLGEGARETAVNKFSNQVLARETSNVYRGQLRKRAHTGEH